ncbi:hypothetical protein, partial [Actinomadura sp. LOL_011]
MLSAHHRLVSLNLYPAIPVLDRQAAGAVGPGLFCYIAVAGFGLLPHAASTAVSLVLLAAGMGRWPEQRCCWGYRPLHACRAPPHAGPSGRATIAAALREAATRSTAATTLAGVFHYAQFGSSVVLLLAAPAAGIVLLQASATAVMTRLMHRGAPPSASRAWGSAARDAASGVRAAPTAA